LHHRNFKLADLVALGQVRIEVVLRAKMLRSAMCALTPKPNSIARSTAPMFITGKVPGKAMSTAQACVLGSAPNATEARLKILLFVESCACVSKPMTTS